MIPDPILRREATIQRLGRRSDHGLRGVRRCIAWLRTPRTRSEEGAALVEFALTVTMLLVLLFGTIVVCMAFYTYNVVTEAAKAGSRYAIVRGSESCGDLTPGCNATSPSIQDYVRSLSFPGINPSNLNVTATWSPSNPGEDCTPSPSCNNPGDYVHVNVRYTFDFAIPFIPSQALAMSSRSQMIISQ